MRYFDIESAVELDSPETLRRIFLAEWTSRLSDWDYRLTSQSEVGITYSRTYRSLWLLIPVILLFPFGLLFLLWKSEVTIVVIAEPDDGGGAVLIISGRAPRALRKSLGQWLDRRQVARADELLEVGL